VFVDPTFVAAVYVHRVPAVSGVALHGLSFEGCAKATLTEIKAAEMNKIVLTELDKTAPILLFNAFILQ
jgi:hypothetical protein